MIDFLLSMVLATNLLPRGQAARLDSHAHSSRLLKGGATGDYGTPLALPIYIDENEGNT